MSCNTEPELHSQLGFCHTAGRTNLFDAGSVQDERVASLDECDECVGEPRLPSTQSKRGSYE